MINQAGRRAGKVLAQLDYPPLGDVILARDETYFDGLALLLPVEPRTPPHCSRTVMPNTSSVPHS